MPSDQNTIATNDSINASSNSPDSTDPDSSCVQVAVRIRPFLPNESTQKCVHILTTPSQSSPIVQIGNRSSSSTIASYDSSSNMSTNGHAAAGGKSFLFDAAFSPEIKQKHVFQQSIKPLVEACLKGYNATVLAYGQTGSGKTFTILGPSPDSILAEGNDTGVIPRAIRDLFNRLETTRKKCQLEQDVDFQKKKGEKPFEYEVRVQFLELYGEDVRDLLNISSGAKLVIRDGGGGVEPEVIGASEVKVHSAEEALLCLMRGTLRRVTGATAMNSESSRSHAIMTVIVEQTTVVRPGSGNSVSSDGSSNGKGKRSGLSSVKISGNTEIESKRSKFHFVDLAGSERQKRSQSKGQRLREGIDINKGLLVLGNVISALGDTKKRGKSFVPYRDSKLTRLLKGSLGGNHKTLMIACVSPSSANLAETLNCLRYANRAKNIQNNAIINLDAGSKLVAVLRTQVQSLAGELLIVQGQSCDGCSTRFSLDTLKMLAKGGDSSSNLRTANEFGFKRSRSNENLVNVNEDVIKDFEAKIAQLQSVTKQGQEDLTTKSEELFAAKAESEYYRLQISSEDGNFTSEEGKDAFVNRAQAYEQEIETLRKQLRNVKAHSIQSAFQPLTPSSSPSRRVLPDDAPPTPKSSRNKRNRAKTFKPIVNSDDEEKEDNEEIQKITRKYLKIGIKKGTVLEDEDDEIDDRAEDKDAEIDEDEDGDETSMSRQTILSSHMLQLTNGIIAKQELIGKLESSQIKYEKMRSFYHGKLKKMTMQLSLQEAEKVKLETELKNNEKDSQKYSELTLQLNAKQKHIDQLKRRHAEVKALTSIASRNEAVIANLTTEIEEMKRYKSSLESQLLKERKEHAKMLQHFQKKASTQQKNATKMRLQLATTLAQKQKVQEIAKAHAEEITELRSKYKSAEKKLRMQTLKRGMMEKAGIDPVLTGHHGRRTSTKPAKTSYNRNDTRSHSSGDTHRMRNFLDDKIAEISRKEAAADKLAHEWEDHLDLTNRKEQFIAESNGKRNDITITDEIEALDFQIKYKESRIRQLASKLANKSSNDNISTSKGFSHDTLVGDRAFQSITSDLPPLAASQLASKVLFGIVVRERRRVATLARAASTLDQKALQAEKLAADREAALKSLIDETKNERVAMAQNQQEKILSLMEIVQGEGQEEETEVSAELRTSLSESVVLRLANERIETVEAQLSDLKQEKESRETYQAREAETVNELKQLTQDYSHLLETSKALRTSLLKIRDRITATSKSHDPAILTTIINIIAKTLKSISQAAKIDKENADRRNISSHYEDSDSEDYDGNEVPEWAGHIMKDLAIIAAGEVPASLRTPREGGKQRLPRTPGGSVFDRLSSPENFTTSHYERLSDNASVGSNTARSRSTSRSRHNTPSRDERSSYTPLRYRSSRSPSPMRQRSPHHSETRLTDRVSAILKDGPPRVLSSPNYPIDDDEQSFRSTGSRSVRSSGSRSARSGRRHLAAESKFVKAYTKKDVFERLQKKHTNSYILNVKASQTHDSAKQL